MSKSNLLIELGFEEIPASYLKPGLDIWVDSINKILGKNEIEFENIESFFTPRRYAIHIIGIMEDISVKTVEITGPPSNIAKNESGWTKAAEGFAKSQGKSVNDIYFTKKGKNEVCALKVEKKKKTVDDVLRENIVKSIESIRFPKTMIWEKSKFRFARPIRWLLILKDKTVLSGIEFAGIVSSDYTFGNRLYGNGKLEITSIEDYFKKIEENHVVINREERKRIILKKINEIENEKNISVVTDKELLDEITCMVESPTVLLGQFHNQYTELPEKIVTTAMKQHQRYFSVVNGEKKIAPFFVFVSNTDRNTDEIIKNNEKVLKSRLEDAYFYYEEDLKVPVERRIEIQKDILWHRDLGTIYEKAIRVSDIAYYLSRVLHLNLDKDELRKIALHLKIDLSTNMIKDGKEFTKLEGYIGSIYARKLGVDETTASVILEHNLPRFAKDTLPESIEGAIFALADRYDTIAGFIAKYGLPKGSKDPFGIKRNTNGIIEITVAKEWYYDFMLAVDNAFSNFDINYDNDKLYNFFIDRIINYAQNENIKYDIINAIAALRLTDISDIILRSRVLHNYREMSEKEFESLVTGQKRVANILRNISVEGDVNPSLFNEKQEKVLYGDCLHLSKIIESLIKKRDYSGILKEYFKIRPSIDKFFDDVMVMTEEEKIRTNRLRLMKFLRGLFLKVADFSEIVIEGEK